MCLCLLETHVWSRQAGGSGRRVGWQVCPSTLGQPGYQRRTWDCDYWSPDWYRSSRTFLMGGKWRPITHTDVNQWQVNSLHGVWCCTITFPSTGQNTLLMVNWAGDQKLTEGEKEGIKADPASWRNLRNEPLCYTADEHCKRSQEAD